MIEEPTITMPSPEGPTITVFAQGTPKGQPRPRAFAMGGKARMYDPKTAEAWKNQIALSFQDSIPSVPLMGPVRLQLRFYLQRPKDHFLRGIVRAIAPFWCEKKPDVDNYAKAVMDALTTLYVWHDDSQVVDLHALKFYVNDHRVGCGITVTAFSAQGRAEKPVQDTLNLGGIILDD